MSASNTPAIDSSNSLRRYDMLAESAPSSVIRQQVPVDAYSGNSGPGVQKCDEVVNITCHECEAGPYSAWHSFCAACGHQFCNLCDFEKTMG